MTRTERREEAARVKAQKAKDKMDAATEAHWNAMDAWNRAATAVIREDEGSLRTLRVKSA